MKKVTVSLNGADITTTFQGDNESRTFIGAHKFMVPVSDADC